VVSGVVDIGREDIVLAILLGSDLETSPDAVTSLKNTVGAISRLGDIDRLEDGGSCREFFAGIDEQQLVIALQ